MASPFTVAFKWQPVLPKGCQNPQGTGIYKHREEWLFSLSVHLTEGFPQVDRLPKCKVWFFHVDHCNLIICRPEATPTTKTSVQTITKTIPVGLRVIETKCGTQVGVLYHDFPSPQLSMNFTLGPANTDHHLSRTRTLRCTMEVTNFSKRAVHTTKISTEAGPSISLRYQQYYTALWHAEHLTKGGQWRSTSQILSTHLEFDNTILNQAYNIPRPFTSSSC